MNFAMTIPSEHSSFSIARALLVMGCWSEQSDAPLEFTRWMLLDFAVEHPAALSALLPELAIVARAYDLDERSVADIYARRRLADRRPQFAATVQGLAGRRLVTERIGKMGTPEFELTAAGRKLASSFSSRLALAISATAEVVVQKWARRNPDRISQDLRRQFESDDEVIATFEFFENMEFRLAS